MKTFFLICFSSAVISFGSKAKKAKYTNFEKSKELSTAFLPTNKRFLICQTLRTLVKLFFATWKFMLSCSLLLYEIWTPRILIEYSICYTNFLPQSATLIFFRTQMAAISHFSRLGYSPLTFEYSLRLLKTSLAEFKSFTKKVVSPAYVVHRYSWSKLLRPKASFLI